MDLLIFCHPHCEPDQRFSDLGRTSYYKLVCARRDGFGVCHYFPVWPPLGSWPKHCEARADELVIVEDISKAFEYWQPFLEDRKSTAICLAGLLSEDDYAALNQAGRGLGFAIETDGYWFGVAGRCLAGQHG